MSVIGYENLGESATITPDEEATGFPVENAVDWRLDDWWKGTTTDSFTTNIVFDLATAQSVDYFAMAGHNFGSGSISYNFQYDSADNPAFTSATSALGSGFSPTDDSVVIHTFSSISKRYWRVRLGGSAGSPAPIIGQVSFGVRYEPPTGMRPGHVPPKYGINHKYVSNLSDTGQFVGRSLVRNEFQTSIMLDYLTAAQMRTDIDPLLAHAVVKPFFFLWDETNYSTEAAYCWLMDAPQITTTPAPFYNVALKVGCVV